MSRTLRAVLALLALLATGVAAAAEPAFRITPVDAAWYAALPWDPQAATDAFMASIPADVKARADAYFEGGYWLQLWNLLLGLVVAALLLATPWSAPAARHAAAPPAPALPGQHG